VLKKEHLFASFYGISYKMVNNEFNDKYKKTRKDRKTNQMRVLLFSLFAFSFTFTLSL